MSNIKREKTKKVKLHDAAETSSQPRAAYRPASPSRCECVREKQEGERPRDIERKVSGQRLSEIYPHSEACKREDAGS